SGSVQPAVEVDAQEAAEPGQPGRARITVIERVPRRARPGQVVQRRIRVRASRDDARDTVVCAPLAPGEEVLSTRGARRAAESGGWMIGDLARGGTRTRGLTVGIVAARATTIRDRVRATAANAAPQTTGAPLQVVPLPATPCASTAARPGGGPVARIAC